MVVKKKDFLGKAESLSTVGYAAGQELVKKIKVEKKPVNPIALPNITYEFNSAELDKKAKRTIDSLVLTFLNMNPTLIIELHSHTDSKGNDEFNMDLSQRRAESIVSYLIKKGISRKRLVAVGFGESQPVAPNQKPDGSDNPEGRAKNRRTDMKVVGEIIENE
jgi:outer membrane protein OmpA-like peptidoglycan-associated protein